MDWGSDVHKEPLFLEGSPKTGIHSMLRLFHCITITLSGMIYLHVALFSQYGNSIKFTVSLASPTSEAPWSPRPRLKTTAAHELFFQGSVLKPYPITIEFGYPSSSVLVLLLS